VIASCLAADCGGQSCMVAPGWRGTSSVMTMLVMRATWRLSSGFCGGVAWGFEWCRVELCGHVDVPI
jgi:hypothetical protein